MKLNKDDIYGIAGSVAFHLFILLILGFTVLRTVVPDEDGGILVNFGNVNAAIITSCSFKNVSSMSISYTSTPRTVIPINLGFTSKSPIILNPLLSKSWLFANA